MTAHDVSLIGAPTDVGAACLGARMGPAFDVRNQTAKLAADLIASLFGKSTLMRKAGSGR
jgi:arginase family enzyme